MHRVQEAASGAQWLRLGNTASGDSIHRLGLEMPFHHICQVTGGENDLMNALPGQAAYNPFQKRLARHRHHRLGEASQQVRHPRPEPARQHHRHHPAQLQAHATAQTLE